MSDALDDFAEQDIYKFKRVGSFGRFTANGSFPVDYLMTSMTPAEMDEALAFARDINSEKLDFGLLMQRDIDLQRVNEEITPYLQSEQGSSLQKISFFPPLLAAVVPVKNKTMQTFYADEVRPPSTDELKREWPNHFKVTHKLHKGAGGYTLSLPSEEGETTQYQIRIATTQIELNLFSGHEEGVALVVIDGQHRLKAIKQLYERHKEKLESLVVPVCILFAPEATAHNNDKNEKDLIPNIPLVFRKLFVDVNNSAVQVGGHFTVLLRDTNASSLMCREFCSWILENRGEAELAMVEWNQRSKKDSSKINKNYSVTSVGVMDLALQELLKDTNTKRQVPLFKYLFKIDARKDLVQNESDEEEIRPPTWDSFTLRQKELLAEIARDELAPLLHQLFFETEGFKQAAEAFRKVITQEQRLADAKGTDCFVSEIALDHFLRYKPTSNNNANQKIIELEQSVQDERASKAPSIIKYSIFQRGMLRFWGKVLDLGRRYSASPANATNAAQEILNLALSERGARLDISDRNPYMLHAVYRTNQNIIPTMKTIDAISNLLFAHAANNKVASNIAALLKIDAKSKDEFIDNLQASALTAAKNFLDIYKEARTSDFKKSYASDSALSAEDKETLRTLQDQYESERQQVKQQKLDAKQVSKAFETAVTKHVDEDLERARSALARNLECNVELIAFTDEEAEEIEAE